MKTSIILLLFLLQLVHLKVTECSAELFDICWSKSSSPENKKDSLDEFKVSSSLGETYTCVVSKNNSSNSEIKPAYKGPSAADFIQHLFEQNICTYHLDPYWTYELCHGKYIRQYHEVFQGNKLYLQQYTLGKIGLKQREMLLSKLKKAELVKSSKAPMKKINNIELPYIAIKMIGGSQCEFNKKKLREADVLYVCDLKGSHDIYSIKEVASCSYEVIVRTPFLCLHPSFKPRKPPNTLIKCFATDRSPRIPHSLMKLYLERKEMIENSSKNAVALDRFIPTNQRVFDRSTLLSFLEGKNCISGSTGSQTYEFCYGKYINEYSNGIFGFKTTLSLGKFNEKVHLEWLKAHPYKRPKPVQNRKFITQLFTDGSVSNVTNKPRQTEVKMKCMEASVDWSGLMLYLYEPVAGEYVFGIESPILCEIVSLADENGLVDIKKVT